MCCAAVVVVFSVVGLTRISLSYGAKGGLSKSATDLPSRLERTRVGVPNGWERAYDRVGGAFG